MNGKLQRRIVQMHRLVVAVSLMLAVIVLAGCAGEELVGSIDERRSLEILGFLRSSGIAATRTASSAGRERLFRISVPATDFARAAELVSSSGLLDDRGSNLETVLQPRSFVPPSPEEQAMRARLLAALELERVLDGIPGVVRARVSVGSGRPRSEGGEERLQAMQFLLVVSFRPQDVAEAELKEKIMQILRSLPQNNASIEKSTNVILTPLKLAAESNGGASVELTKLPFPFAFRVPSADLGRIQVQMYAIFVGAVVSALVVGGYLGAVLALWRRRRSRGAPVRSTSVFTNPSGSGNIVAPEVTERKRSNTGMPDLTERRRERV